MNWNNRFDDSSGCDELLLANANEAELRIVRKKNGNVAWGYRVVGGFELRCDEDLSDVAKIVRAFGTSAVQEGGANNAK
jgi:hypothetical protein